MSDPTTILDVVHDALVASVGVLGAWIGGRYAVRVARMSIIDQHAANRAKWKRDVLQKIGVEFAVIAINRIDLVYSHQVIFTQPDATESARFLAESHMDSPPSLVDGMRSMNSLAEQAKFISADLLASKITIFAAASVGKVKFSAMSALDYDDQRKELAAAKNEVTAEVSHLLRQTF